MFKENDIVVLKKPVENIPTGSVGTIVYDVDSYEKDKNKLPENIYVVEFSDENGNDLGEFFISGNELELYLK